MKKVGKEFKTEKLMRLWSTDKKLTVSGKKYRVGRMSYGDFFLEPGIPRGETKPFNRGTLWLEKVPRTDKVKIVFSI